MSLPSPIQVEFRKLDAVFGQLPLEQAIFFEFDGMQNDLPAASTFVAAGLTARGNEDIGRFYKNRVLVEKEPATDVLDLKRVVIETCLQPPAEDFTVAY